MTTQGVSRSFLLDRKVGEWTGKVLVWLGKRARMRGDAHEFAHLHAAVVFGNSNHDGEWPCGLVEFEGYLTRRDERHRRAGSVVTASWPSAAPPLGSDDVWQDIALFAVLSDGDCWFDAGAEGDGWTEPMSNRFACGCGGWTGDTWTQSSPDDPGPDVEGNVLRWWREHAGRFGADVSADEPVNDVRSRQT